MKHCISVVKSNRETVSLLDKIGVTIFMVSFIENHSKRFEEMKANPMAGEV